MKKYYQRYGSFYCVTYHKNGHKKCTVLVETKDEQSISYIKGKFLSKTFLEYCHAITRDEFLKQYIAVACLLSDATGGSL